MKNRVLKYIKDNWQKTIRYNPEDKDTLIGLPFPYTIPCIKDAFQEMYYWDTYFISKALITIGELEQAKNNCNNFIYEVNRFGFVPNGSRTYYLNRSQPPYMALLIKAIYEAEKESSKDNENSSDLHIWLKDALSALEKEYKFWMQNRISDIGLNHYSFEADENYILEVYDEACIKRLSMNHSTRAEKILESSHTIAEAESGWDFNPRFNRRCMNYAPIDLNSNLYFYEVLISELHKDLNTGKTDYWRQKADTRKRLINKYCWNEKRGIFTDYDFVCNKQSDIFSAASLQPLFLKLANQKQAKQTVKATCEFLETDYGVLTCEKGDFIRPCDYQWDYPIGWPPLQMITFQAFMNYNFSKDACRIAEKFVRLVTDCFDKTGDLWEKYNVVTGSCEVNCEYEMPAMMGWTAGAYIEAYYLLNTASKCLENI